MTLDVSVHPDGQKSFIRLLTFLPTATGCPRLSTTGSDKMREILLAHCLASIDA